MLAGWEATSLGLPGTQHNQTSKAAGRRCCRLLPEVRRFSGDVVGVGVVGVEAPPLARPRHAPGVRQVLKDDDVISENVKTIIQ